MKTILVALLWLPMLLPATPYAAETAESGMAPDARWKAWGGEIQFDWSRRLARKHGIEVSRPVHALVPAEDGFERLQIRDATGIDLAVKQGGFGGFQGGRLSVRGGFDLVLADGVIPLRDFVLVPRAGDPFVLDVVAGDGLAWFYIDRLMYKFEDDPLRLSVLAMDLRVTPRLAERVGHPDIAGYVIAAMRMTAYAHGEGFIRAGEAKAPQGCGKWHGCTTPGDERYLADVFMQTFSGQLTEPDSGDEYDGPGGTDGRVIYTPSSTLRNNRNNGSVVCTIPSTGSSPPSAPPCADPLGASSATHAADVPWHTKFSGLFDPHGNDQHPFLIWNLYRIDAEGRIAQIGRSGVKHAWLTTNFPCDENPGNGHILGRGCSDTYGVGNNDTTSDLGPRSEIIPATGEWGRCGSVYDSDCDGVQDSGAPCSNVRSANCQSWAFRMAVRETRIDPALNPGATYLMESWYIVRDDIDIYNTMQTRPVSFLWNASAQTWPMSNATPLRLGPAIDRHVARGTHTANERSSDIDTRDGEARVVSRVTPLPGGRYRYDYAVMNFDFAKANVTGTVPDRRVLSNDGFVSFQVPLAGGVVPTEVEFDDGDNSTGNDWSASISSGFVRWAAPAGNRLNWGTLFRFGFVANAAPASAPVQLVTAQVAPLESLPAGALVPQDVVVQTYRVGGDLIDLGAGTSIVLQLNGGNDLLLEADGAFSFDPDLTEGSPYSVTVQQQPLAQECDVASGEGVIGSSDVTDVEVTCVDLQYHVGGTLSGLGDGGQLGLRLNGGDLLLLDADGAFAFEAQPLSHGAGYEVTIASQPEAQNCEVTEGAGEIEASDVVSVAVQCRDQAVPGHLFIDGFEPR